MESKRNLHRYDIIEAENYNERNIWINTEEKTSICDSWQ